MDTQNRQLWTPPIRPALGRADGAAGASRPLTLDYKFRVSSRIRKEFNNGEEYYALDGSRIWLPRDVDGRPQREALEWHADSVFTG